MKKVFVGALIATAATAGCSSLKQESREANPAPCPNVVVLNDAARIVEFEGEQDLENIAYTGEITNVGLACRYFADKPIDAELEIDLAFGKGPKGVDGEKVFTYFVAVTRTDLEVIWKDEFAVAADFSEKKTIVVETEKFDQLLIPRKDENTSGLNFEIIVGFSLTADQVRFNRSGKSLKFPNL